MESDAVLDHVAAAGRAVSALDEHLRVLLGLTDVLRVMGHEHASHELQRALMRSIHVLQALRDELVCLEVIEVFVRNGRPLS